MADPTTVKPARAVLLFISDGLATRTSSYPVPFTDSQTLMNSSTRSANGPEDTVTRLVNRDQLSPSAKNSLGSIMTCLGPLPLPSLIWSAEGHLERRTNDGVASDVLGSGDRPDAASR
jgi:hypothetical protein